MARRTAANSEQYVPAWGLLLVVIGGILYLAQDLWSSPNLVEQAVGNQAGTAAGAAAAGVTAHGESNSTVQDLRNEERNQELISLRNGFSSREIAAPPFPIGRTASQASALESPHWTRTIVSSLGQIPAFLAEAKNIPAVLGAQKTRICEAPSRLAACTDARGSTASCLLWQRLQEYCETVLSDKEVVVAALGAWRELGTWVKYDSNELALQEVVGDVLRGGMDKYLSVASSYSTERRRPRLHCYENASRSYLQYAWEAKMPGMQRWKGSKSQFEDCLRMKIFFAGDSLSNQFARSLMLASIGHRPGCSDGVTPDGEYSWSYRCGNFHIVFKRVNTPITVDHLNRTQLEGQLQLALNMYLRDPAPRKYLVLGLGQWMMPWTKFWYRLPYIWHIDHSGTDWVRGSWLQAYKFAARFILQEVKLLLGQDGCHRCVYWMTTPPRHGVGPFQPGKPFTDACDWEPEVPASEFRAMNGISASIAQNMVVRPLVLGETNFSIVETEAILGSRADAHHRWSMEAGLNRSKRDCLHYCIPGPWTDVVMNLIWQTCSAS
eukprot:TRINITY_DN44848_c0_g2_i1.p1 TRINITY_DN44848_c0_g2~~TRINITY_DN44848_c0_g2_i1.p1  ORF type:complete len:550 (-),score=43.50 TRINITY_DN44848_c0_g2_i1:398-2047(-)